MPNTFHDDYSLSVLAQPHQDDIYKSIFPIKKITRFNHEEDLILDKKYHIDVELELINGIKLLGQEKALRAHFAKFDTFTIEFYQNRFRKEPGEFFNIGAQFYLHGYWNESYNGFCKWYLIKLFDFLTYLKKLPLEQLEKQTRPSTSRASFYYITYNKIPSEFFYRTMSEVSEVI